MGMRSTLKAENDAFMGDEPDADVYAIQVVWDDGETEYVKEGVAGDPLSPVKTYTNRKKAQADKDFIEMGLEGNQSIAVVRYAKS